MRGSGKVFSAALVLTLCAAVADVACAAEKEPVSGGLLPAPGYEAPAPGVVPTAAPPAPAPAPVAAKTGQGDNTSWGLLLRGGYFGLPDPFADRLFLQHPEIAGSSFGAEIRYHGEDGGRGVASVGLAIDSATAEANGIWQEDASTAPIKGAGEISMLAFTLTGYWSLLPSWFLHPYVGLGIGVAHAQGHYLNETERVEVDYWVPVVHIPVGLALELGERLQLAAEARFIDGFALGGALQVRF